MDSYSSRSSLDIHPMLHVSDGCDQWFWFYLQNRGFRYLWTGRITVVPNLVPFCLSTDITLSIEIAWNYSACNRKSNTKPWKTPNKFPHQSQLDTQILCAEIRFLEDWLNYFARELMFILSDLFAMHLLFSYVPCRRQWRLKCREPRYCRVKLWVVPHFYFPLTLSYTHVLLIERRRLNINWCHRKRWMDGIGLNWNKLNCFELKCIRFRCMSMLAWKRGGKGWHLQTTLWNFTKSRSFT